MSRPTDRPTTRPPDRPAARPVAAAEAPAGTRERVVEATIELLRASGFEGAGINRILAASGAPKGSLYHFFPEGKRQIAREALALYGERVLARCDAALAGGRTPGQKVRRLLAVPARRLEDASYVRSCAAGAVSLDLEHGLEGVRDAVAAFFERFIALCERHLAPAFADPKRARAFAGLLLTTIEGAYVRGRAEHSTAAFREAAEWLAPLADAGAGPAQVTPARATAGRSGRSRCPS